MRRPSLALISSAVLLLASPALAMCPMCPGGKNPEKKLQKMTENLNLSPEQVEQMRALQGEMRAFRDQHRAKVQAILSAEQWQKMEQQRQNKCEGKHKGKQGHKQQRQQQSSS